MSVSCAHLGLFLNFRFQTGLEPYWVSYSCCCMPTSEKDQEGKTGCHCQSHIHEHAKEQGSTNDLLLSCLVLFFFFWLAATSVPQLLSDTLVLISFVVVFKIKQILGEREGLGLVNGTLQFCRQLSIIEICPLLKATINTNKTAFLYVKVNGVFPQLMLSH